MFGLYDPWRAWYPATEGAFFMAIIDLHGIPDFVHTEATWEEYEELLEATQDRHLRITYDRGQLEIVPPSFKHEGGKCVIGTLLDTLMIERRILFKPAGELLMHRKALLQGLEPDLSYWIANRQAMVDKEEWLPERDPPPDLAIEIDVSRSSINRMDIYARLGVPEVWRFRRGKFTVNVLLATRAYETDERSPLFPDIPMDAMERFVEVGIRTSVPEMVWAFQDWLRTH